MYFRLSFNERFIKGCFSLYPVFAYLSLRLYRKRYIDFGAIITRKASRTYLNLLLRHMHLQYQILPLFKHIYKKVIHATHDILNIKSFEYSLIYIFTSNCDFTQHFSGNKLYYIGNFLSTFSVQWSFVFNLFQFVQCLCNLSIQFIFREENSH